MADVQTMIGPSSAGQRMGLDEFTRVEGKPGHFYELAKGVIVVVDVPHLGHGRIVDTICGYLSVYRATNPDVIHYLAGGADACLRLAGMESERHPDISVYLTPPPEPDSPWDRWTPSIVVEVVSKSSTHRDYVEKREEYLAAGITEYWIIDPAKGRILVLRRRGDVWTEHPIAPDGSYSTGLLPEFALDASKIFPNVS